MDGPQKRSNIDCAYDAKGNKFCEYSVLIPLAGAMLPDWLPESLWSEFRKMRVKIRHPLTEYGEGLILARLERFKADGLDPIGSINEAIEGSWRGVYPPKNGHANLSKAIGSAQISPNSCKKCGSTIWVRLDRYKHCERCQ